MHGGVSIQQHHGHGAFAKREGRLDRLQDAVAVLGANHDTVHHRFNVVNLVPVDFEPRFELHQFSIHAGTEVPQPHDLFKQLSVVAFSSAHHGGEQQQFLAIKPVEDVVRDLVVRVPNHGLSGFQREGIGRTGIEQAQKVVQLGHGAHGGTRVFGHGLLLDGHHRTQPGDGLHIRTLQASEELPGVRTQRFQKAALTFCVECVEGQTGFSAPTHPGEHHQFVAWQNHVHLLQIVFRSARDDEVVLTGVSLGVGGRSEVRHGGSTIGLGCGSPQAVAAP